MSAREVVAFYRVRRRTFDYWVASAEPPPHITKDGKRLFIRSELLGWRKPPEANCG